MVRRDDIRASIQARIIYPSQEKARELIPRVKGSRIFSAINANNMDIMLRNVQVTR